MKNLFLLGFFALMLNNFTANAQNVTIPDANFKAALVADLNINTNADAEIQLSEAVAYGGQILINSLSISDLTGIEAFTGITMLNCSFNNLASLDLSSNLALQELYCGYNNLTTLDVSSNIALQSLQVDNNQLTSLNITNAPLTQLVCRGNQLATLDLSTNNTISWLDCSNNLFADLDVSAVTSLDTLDCFTNSLTKLDVSSNLALTSLVCYSNPSLTCLSFLPANLLNLVTDVTCLPNIPVGISWMSTPLCSSLPTNPCFEYPAVSGHVYIDVNNNGTQDPGDFDVSGRVVASAGGVFTSTTNGLGNYNFVMDTSTSANLGISNFNTSYFNLMPATIPITTDGTSSQNFPNMDFRFVPIGNNADARAFMSGGIYRPGFATTIAFICRNDGNTVIDPVVSVTIDPNLTVLSSSVAPNGAGGNNMTFSFTGLLPLSITTIYVEVFVPTSILIGTAVTNSMLVTITNDVRIVNNDFTENAVVVGSFDPNDKTANLDYITPTQVAAGEEIEYTIRFQNTGTFPADFVIVTDTLDNDLDASSLEMISTSHALSKMTIETAITHPNQPNIVKWYFYNINLADSTSDEPHSHGYIYFSIKPKTTLTLGTLIENTAGIVFDFNTPVITNTCVIPVSLGSSILSTITNEVRYTVYPNPVNSTLYIQAENSKEYSISLLSINGQLVYSAQNKTEMTELDMRHFTKGMYLLQVQDAEGVYTQKVIVE